MGRPKLSAALKRKPRTFKLSPDAIERIEVLGKVYGLTKTAVVEGAVMAYRPKR